MRVDIEIVKQKQSCVISLAQYILWIFGVGEWSFEVELSRILRSLVGFTKTNTELFL